MWPAHALSDTNGVTVLLVVGAGGEPQFETNFVQQARLWEKAARQAGAQTITIGLEEARETNHCAQLKRQLAAEPHEGLNPLWLVLIGHGTFDGKEAKFNLQGPDVSAAELAEQLKPFRRPILVVNTASASAPFVAALSATNRVVITATRSGHEQNFTRLGQYLAGPCRAAKRPGPGRPDFAPGGLLARQRSRGRVLPDRGPPGDGARLD